MSHVGDKFTRQEVSSTYVSGGEQYIVSLIVGYAVEDAKSPLEAVELALDLTRDGGRGGTNWYVHDRETGETLMVEQEEVEAKCTPVGGEGPGS